jgi:rhodanese-related sulfurtransferase
LSLLERRWVSLSLNPSYRLIINQSRLNLLGGSRDKGCHVEATLRAGIHRRWNSFGTFPLTTTSSSSSDFSVRTASENEDDMPTSVKLMMEAANAAVSRITPARAREMIAKGDTLVVDVRDAPEVEKSGKIAGAIQVSRGMLEFRADPDSPYHDKNFDKSKRVILYCASGGRSALGGKVLKDMGYDRVYNLGAFKDWAETGAPVEKPSAA